MNADKESSLNHFAALGFQPTFWQLSGEERKGLLQSCVQGIAEIASAVHLYQSYPLETGTDLLIWSSTCVRSKEQPREFFQGWLRAIKPLRPYLIDRHQLWGFTRPSVYSKAKSSQEIDPYAKERSPYLIMYPFTKTADWYLLDQDTRQGMMNEHMRIGKQYREISQLLLYSFGIQDQEFVVVYETDDLQLFSKLVYDLRNTEARRFTKGDTPLHTGIYSPLKDVLNQVG